MSRLARSGKLMQVCRGVYTCSIETRFVRCTPGMVKSIAALSALWGETIVPNAAAADYLGLTMQNQVRVIYLTSGSSRMLHFGKSTVELRHAPRWQLMAPNRTAGAVVPALVWLGLDEVEIGLDTVLSELSLSETDQLADARAALPTWFAEPLSARISRA